MDTILDRFGNKLQVTMYCYPAYMWVLSDINDVPVACSAISRVNGVGFEWEDEQYGDYELLHNLRNKKGAGKFKIKDKEFILYYHEADYFAGITDGKVMGCVAIKPDGEMFCRWNRWHYYKTRLSLTALAWTIRAYSATLEKKYLSRGVSKLYGYVEENNKESNRYHKSRGAKLTGQIKGNGVTFNRYEDDISQILENAESLRPIWEANSIGDFDNPSILIQDEVYVG